MTLVERIANALGWRRWYQVAIEDERSWMSAPPRTYQPAFARVAVVECWEDAKALRERIEKTTRRRVILSKRWCRP